MAKRKAKKEEFNPNPYEGFRATTREANMRVEVYMSMTGNEGTLEDVMIASYPADIKGRGKADLIFLCVQMMAVALNGGLPPAELAHVWNGVVALSTKYRVALPPGWTCLSVAGVDLSDYQILYVREGTGEVIVVEPDTGIMVTSLEDMVFQGRQNIVAPGCGGETPKIQSQPNRGEKKGDQG